MQDSATADATETLPPPPASDDADTSVVDYHLGQWFYDAKASSGPSIGFRFISQNAAMLVGGLVLLLRACVCVCM